MNERFR